MVDPVNSNVSGVNRVQEASSQRTQERREEKKEARSEKQTDSVEISKEAISQFEAEQAAKAAREALGGSDLSLGLDPGFGESS